MPLVHPLRRIKAVADAALTRLSPERMLNVFLLIALYSVRSGRAFCKEFKYNLLFWCLDMDPLELSFDVTVFTKNRQRLLAYNVGWILCDEVVWAADAEGLLSDDHFCMEGTLIEAVASLKSFRLKDGPPPDDDPGNSSMDFRGERRSHAMHASTMDPEARLLRKGRRQEDRFIGWPQVRLLLEPSDFIVAPNL